MARISYAKTVANHGWYVKYNIPQGKALSQFENLSGALLKQGHGMAIERRPRPSFYGTCYKPCRLSLETRWAAWTTARRRLRLGVDTGQEPSHSAELSVL